MPQDTLSLAVRDGVRERQDRRAGNDQKRQSLAIGAKPPGISGEPLGGYLIGLME
jgi:hypothetical protein